MNAVSLLAQVETYCRQHQLLTSGERVVVAVSGGPDSVCLLDLHLADLLPAEPKPTRDDTMAYRVTESDVIHLTDSVVAVLRETMAAGVTPVFSNNNMLSQHTSGG